MNITKRREPNYPEKHWGYTLSNRLFSSSFLSFLSQSSLIAIAFSLFACSSTPPREAVLQLHWEGAARDTTTLVVHMTDSLEKVSVDTLCLTGKSGKETLYFPLTSTAKAFLYPTTGEWAFAIQLAPRREVRVELDFASPRLHTSRGYPEAELRRQFVRKEKKTLQELDRIDLRLREQGAIMKKNERSLLVQEGRRLERFIQTQAAHFIVANKEKEGIAALAEEYFASFEGALAFLKIYPEEQLPMELLRLSNYIAYWKSRGADTLWRIKEYFPMPQSLRKEWEEKGTAERYLLIAMTDSLWGNEHLQGMYQALRADTLSQSLRILTLIPSRTDTLVRADTTHRKVVWQDSLARSTHYYTKYPSPLLFRYISRHLGVQEMPYFVVITKENRILYRGNKLTPALDSVRKKQTYR